MYYWHCAILHPTISNVSRHIVTVYYYIYIAGTSRKLVKIGGLSKCLEPPWFFLRACSVTRMGNK